MKILVVGNGGREHALAWRLAGTPGARIFITRGNGGTASVAEPLDIAPSDIEGIVEAARAGSFDLVAVGPEAPLAAGLADRLLEAGVRVFGPVKAGARLEASKAFAHEIMDAAGVPCAGSLVFDDADAVLRHVTTCSLPVVLKADGLAAGKGVVIATSRDEAIETVKAFMVDGRLGLAGRTLVVEEFLEGEEASFMVLTDGDFVLPLAGARDHKRAFDGDLGPNTGGMGAFSPTRLVKGSRSGELVDGVIRPVLTELARRGIRYQGVLYAGMMFTAEGPKVLEFNCRFGDPETQPVLYRMRGDLAEAMIACGEGWLDKVSLDFDPRPSVCVVLAAHGYPEAPRTGDTIHGLDDAARLPDVHVFHAGTRLLPDGSVVTSGGRVLGVTAIGDDIAGARARAYEATARIRFNGMQFRRDIGASA